MLTLNIQAPDTEALWAQLRAVLQGAIKEASPSFETIEQVEALTTKIAESKSKARTKAKVEAATDKQPDPEPAKEPEPKAEEAPKPATLDDLRAALMALSKAKGEQIVWELMKDFDVQKASAVPAEQRAEVIALANKWAAQQ